MVVAAPPLVQESFIPFTPGITGKIDHLTIDLKTNRMFVCTKGNNSVSVLDLAAKRQIALISAGLMTTQDVVYVGSTNPPLLYVANANGHVRAFNGLTYASTSIDVNLGINADNMRFDSQRKILYVGYGEGPSAIAAIDAVTGARKPDASVNVVGHPESFLLNSDNTTIYVNIVTRNAIYKVSNTATGGDGKFSVLNLPTGYSGHYALLLMEQEKVIIVPTRVPSSLLVLSSVDGKLINVYPTVNDVDDLFYDHRLQRIYVTGGDGNVAVYQRADSSATKWTSLGNVASGTLGRTGVWSPELDRLFVAVQGARPGVMVFKTQA